MAKIVVVEDEKSVCDVVVQALKFAGHTVQAFEDARPALEEVDFSQTDLVVTDLEMPTSGEELIQTLRRRGIRTPVLVMSGHMDEERKRHLAALGAQETIDKPFGLPQFLATVKALIH
jgi:DNA-binding response OmpR family regulator